MNKEYCISASMKRLGISDKTFVGLQYKLQLELLWSELYEPNN